MQRRSNQGNGNKEMHQLTINIDSKFADVEEKLNEKANKQSVA